jgi:glucoamylase
MNYSPENIYLTGSIDALSYWSTSSALGPLDNTDTYPVWTISVTIPANTTFQYKYIRKNNVGGAVTWESGPNRFATSPASGATVTLTDTWR